MQITASAVSLNVEDVAASSVFLTEHFGFRRERLFQVTDPNGVIVQLMDWTGDPVTRHRMPRASGRVRSTP